MLRNVLRETVCIRLVISFCIGIIGYNYLHQYLSTILVLLVMFICIILALIYIIFLVNKFNFTFKLYNGILVFFICANYSFLIAYTQDDRNFNGYKALLNEKEHQITILSNAKKTTLYYTYEVNIQHNVYSSVQSLLSVKDSIVRYNIGDVLKVRSKLKAIDYINHPGQFDYKHYLERKHIYHKLIAENDDIKLVSKNEEFSIMKFSYAQRTKLLNILRANISDNTSYEMAAALLLGERTELDKKLLKSYSDTGTIHIISVSGLHVGIIYLVLQMLFRKIPYLRNKHINCILIISCIWFYATLTGLPSSVIRSALMISFSSIGKSFSSNSNPINHVAGSALVILSFDTSYLFDIGFQLSYLAVLGIMYLQKPISNLYIPSSKLGIFVWETSSVSIAAQLFTLPLCWYYFHQFPNYFLLANLIAIPLSSVALYACIANLVFAYVPYLNKLCEWILVTSIKLMNEYLTWISNWPYSVSQLGKINIFQSIIICLILFFFLLFWKEKIKHSFKYILICLIIYTSYTYYITIKHQHQHLWIIPNGRDCLFTIESNSTLKHIYSFKMKPKNINQQLNYWKNYSNKDNEIKLINSNKFCLKIDSISYFRDNQTKLHLRNNYNRICLK